MRTPYTIAVFSFLLGILIGVQLIEFYSVTTTTMMTSTTTTTTTAQQQMISSLYSPALSSSSSLQHASSLITPDVITLLPKHQEDNHNRGDIVTATLVKNKEDRNRNTQDENGGVEGAITTPMTILNASSMATATAKSSLSKEAATTATSSVSSSGELNRGNRNFVKESDPQRQPRKQHKKTRRQHHQERSNVVIFVCTRRYGHAVAASIKNLRKRGGYQDDVVLIMHEEPHFRVPAMRTAIVNLGGSLANLTIYTTKELYDSLLLTGDVDNDSAKRSINKNSNISSSSNSNIGNTSRLDYLRHPPPAPECMGWHRKRGHPAYYMKMLIFHPIFTKWDNILFLDGCMTYHSPHVHEILTLPEIDGHILASPDPWEFGHKMLGGRTLECADERSIEVTTNYVGRDLANASYFTTGLILYDGAIVRDYSHSSSSTLIELLELYHELAPVFEGDQLIASVYWVYMRGLFRILPTSIFGSPRVPYSFDVGSRQAEGSSSSNNVIISVGNSNINTCESRPSVHWEGEGHSNKKHHNHMINLQRKRRLGGGGGPKERRKRRDQNSNTPKVGP